MTAFVAVSFIGAAIAAEAGAYPEIRVEGLGKTLDPGTHYRPHETSIKSADSNCDPVAGFYPVAGRTPMGLLGDAAEFNKRLRPLRAAQFGGTPYVCQAGAAHPTSMQGWAFRLNHLAVSTPANALTVRGRDHVLWYMLDFGTGENTGDELALKAPVRAKPGAVNVSVTGYPFGGGSHPATDGTAIKGGDAPVTTTGGVATVMLGHPGVYRLQATFPTAIRSQKLTVCVNEQLARCPARRKQRIVR